MALSHKKLAEKRARANAKRKNKKYNPNAYPGIQKSAQRAFDASHAGRIVDTDVLDLS